MTRTHESIEAGLERFAALLGDHSQLREELGSSGLVFFGGDPPRHDPAEALLAARRHLEWFLFERHSPSVFGSPAEHLLEAWLVESPSDLGDRGEVLLKSFVSIFEVGEALPEVGCWLKDVAGFGNYVLSFPMGDGRLRTGDLLVGRLFPVEDGMHFASSAAAIFRSPQLAEALEQDLERIRSKTPGKVLRLSQQGLEQMFWGSGHRPQSQDPVGDLRSFLKSPAGLSDHRVESILAHLKSSPFDPQALIQGAGDVLGAVLDELAFETDIDLEVARKHLVLAWQELTRSQEHAPEIEAHLTKTDAGSCDPAEAVARFDAGRVAGQELDALFNDLERDLGLASGAEDEGDQDSPAPDFPGVVGAMIEEHRWETQRDHGPEAHAQLDSLALLAEFAAPIGVFEEMDASDLLRFLSFWVHERKALESAQHARDLLGALASFCSWVQEAHEHPLLDEFGPTLERLKESLPRIVELNQALPPQELSADDPRGRLYEVQADTQGHYSNLRDRNGESHAAKAEIALTNRLRAGDRIHGWIDLEGNLTIRRCYPPEAAGLIPDSSS